MDIRKKKWKKLFSTPKRLFILKTKSAYRAPTKLKNKIILKMA